MSNLIDTIADLLSDYLKTTIDSDDIQPIDNSYHQKIHFTYQKRFFIRILNQHQNEKNYMNEINCSQIASNHQLAPTLHLSNKQYQLLIVDFAAGDHPNFQDYQSSNFQQQLLNRVRQLHAISPELINHAKNPQQTFHDYLNQNAIHDTTKKTVNRLKQKVAQWQKKIDALSQEVCFIHNDLNPYNIIKQSNSNITFIDWSDSGIGSPFCDLAEIAVFIEPHHHRQLLNCYQDTIASDDDLQLLHLHWQLRFAIFGAWALKQATCLLPSQIDLNNINLPEPNQSYLTLFNELLSDHQQLTSYQHFLLFASIMWHQALESE